MHGGPEQTFFERRHSNGQQTYGKMLNITNHQGNENQNHNEISPPTLQNGCYQKGNKKQLLVMLLRKGGPRALLVGMQIGAATMEKSMEFLQKNKNRVAV